MEGNDPIVVDGGSRSSGDMGGSIVVDCIEDGDSCSGVGVESRLSSIKIVDGQFI